MAAEPKRNVRAFGLTSLFNDTASEMAYWVLPAFLTSIGGGPATLGLIEGVAESVAAAAKLYSGLLVDRTRRRKPFVVAGYIAANIAKPLLAVSTFWWHVLLVRFTDRLSKGIRGAPRDVMVAESVERANVGSAFGVLQTMDSAGAILGPLAAFLLVGAVGQRGVFWLAAAPGTLAILAVLFFTTETGRDRTKTPADRPPVRAGAAALPGRFYYLMCAIAVFSIGNSSDMFLVLRAQGIGIPASQAPLLGLVFNVTYTTFSWPAGKLSDRMPGNVLVAAGYGVFAVVYAVFALAASKLAIWSAFAFYGLFYAMTNPVLRALVANAAPPESRGRAFGIYYFVTSVAALLASILTGLAWKQFGAAVPFGLSAGLAGAASLMILAGKREGRSNEAAAVGD
jgi:MFS family permease